MASRTKSFFEQDSRPKPNSDHWQCQHSNKNYNKVALGEVDFNTLNARPPIPPTAQVKSKLKAFAFIEGCPTERDKSEVQDEIGRDASPTLLERHSGSPKAATFFAPSPVEEPMRMSTSCVAPEEPHLPHAHTFPSTPGMRLPLADLIGNLDDKIIRPEPDICSPEDQLTWIPNSSSEFLTPSRRKRKRARSSSPSCPTTSSQRQAPSAYFASATATHSKTLDADPAADLWQRYAGGGLKLPDLYNFRLQASPRALETPVKSAGLRRWASTGNDWPSTRSKNKRQRKEPSTDIGLWQDEQQNSLSGKSKVAFLVEKIQESLASQNLAKSTVKDLPQEPAPPSSSPIQQVETAMREQSSPLHPKLQATILESVTGPTKRVSALSHSLHSSPKASPSQVEPSITHQERHYRDPFIFAPLKLQSKAPLPAFKRPSINRTSSGGGRVYPTAQIAEPMPEIVEVGNDLDEFGDDFELSAEDLEELVSQPQMQQRSLYDIPPHPDPLPEPIGEFDDTSFSISKVNERTQVLNEFGLSDDDDVNDEFGCDDIDEDSFAQAEVSATQAYMISPLQEFQPPITTCKSVSSLPSLRLNAHGHSNVLQRFKVSQVLDGEYTNTKGRKCPEKLLMVEDERTSRPTAITLRDSWIQTQVTSSDIIHVAHIRTLSPCAVLPPSLAGQMLISDENNSPLLVVHPDHMLSATTVADSFDCLRKAVLQDCIKATADTSKAMVYGKILHEIFQQALAANQWDSDFLARLIEHTVKSHAEGLWELGMKDTVLAVEEVRTKMTEVSAWAKTFIAAVPGTEALVDDKQGEKVLLSVSKLIAIEEHIWSPQFGLKGNIDATIESTLIDGPDQLIKRFLAPFEVKTGRTTQSAAHRAQTALYTLLLSDRYDVAVEAGILYYLESSSTSRIATPVNEMRQMIQQRNRLASCINKARIRSKPDHTLDQEPEMQHDIAQDIEEAGLPAPIKNPFKCGKCYAQQSCFMYHALAENGTADSAGLIDDGKKNYSLIWHQAVGHLALHTHCSSQADKLRQWFAKWDKLLTLEESSQSRHRKELWTMSSAEREANGRCFGNLVLTKDLHVPITMSTSSSVDGIEDAAGKINRFTYVFAGSASRSAISFAEGSQLTVGEPVVVSTEKGQWALANGYVIATSKYDITVAVDRKLDGARRRLDNFDESRNQVFQGSMTIAAEHDRLSTGGDGVLYRLDKDEFSNGLALIRNNLITLMSTHPIHTKLRCQIIHHEAPTFAAIGTAKLPQTQLGEMNDDQREAVDKVMGAQDYALILGMPGTGKTTTIAHIICALLAEKKTILLTSFTHTAVDNILLKIRDLVPPNSILRLGVPAKIHREVQAFCRLATVPRRTIDDIEEVYMGCQIVATTCMGTNHAVFRRRAFDVCIVDEASQITLPTSLGPLLHARKFVLVGDHYQLPPLVQNRAALEGGFDISLFRQLSEEHPEAVAMLGEQYRMCEDIMTLSNELIYDGKLRCGNEIVAMRTLRPTKQEGLLLYHKNETGAEGQCSVGKLERGHCWLADLTHPTRKVVFANTDSCGVLALETLTSGNRITNTFEATVSTQIVLSFLGLGIPSREIGVITFYRSQLHLIRQIFRNAGIPSDVEIDSADRFQGRDKECIILSMVRSNEIGMVGELLKDWRRINVALTRAKSKLIVLGSRRTLQNNELLRRFLTLVDGRGWAADLPKGADEMHAFNFSSQTALTVPAKTPERAFSPLKPRSPLKNRSPLRPAKNALAPSTRGVLTPSPNVGNRGTKIPGRLIKGTKPTGSARGLMREMKEQIVMDIWDDLTGDEF